MAFEPDFKKVASSNRLRLGSTQAVIECKLPTNDGGEISKILCANAKAYISNTEVSEGEVDFNGYVNFLVMYEGQESMPESLDYSAEFKEKFKNPNIMIGDEVQVTASVVDVNTTKNNATNDIKVVAVVEINIDLLSRQDTNVLVGATGNHVFLQSDFIKVTNLTDSLNERFELQQDVEIKDAIKNVLNVCANSYVEGVTAKNGYVTLSGGVNVNISYLTNQEEPQIRTYETNFDFTQELSSPNATENSFVQGVLNTLYNEQVITTNLDTEKAVLNIVIPMLYDGFVFAENELEVVTDLFSIDNELTTTTKSIVSMVNEGSKSFTEKISGNVVTDESTPFIDEVLGSCCNHVVLASNYLNDDRLIVEGIAYTTVMYYNKEFNSNNSLEVEIPFSLNLMTPELTANAQPIVSIALGDMLIKSKRGTEIDVNAVLFIHADFYSDRTEAVITDVVVGEEKPVNECVLSVYIIKQDDTLWSIAKQLNVSPENILDQNPEIELPLVPGQKIIIYRQQDLAF